MYTGSSEDVVKEDARVSFRRLGNKMSGQELGRNRATNLGEVFEENEGSRFSLQATRTLVITFQ